jgi:hypothetical protein
MEQWWGDEKVQENKEIAGGRIGRKFSAQLFYFFMLLRMVSTLRPWAISIYTIW